MNIAVVGACGKLGSLIVKELKKDNINIIKIDSKLGNSLHSQNNICAVIDASHPNASLSCAKFCSEHNLPLLIACTGHTQEQLTQIHQTCLNIAYCICPNLSVGILFLLQSLKQVKLFSNAKIQITEIHHKNKKDSPSGTAIALQNQIISCGQTVEKINSIRQGNKIGTHLIQIKLPHEEITLTHKALNRTVFAEGAKLAIKELLELPAGNYTLLDLIGGSYEN